MGNIDWLLISDLPDALKDGREVLLWTDGPDVGTWQKGNHTRTRLATLPVQGYWEGLYECAPINNPTHFAEINAPK